MNLIRSNCPIRIWLENLAVSQPFEVMKFQVDSRWIHLDLLRSSGLWERPPIVLAYLLQASSNNYKNELASAYNCQAQPPNPFKHLKIEVVMTTRHNEPPKLNPNINITIFSQPNLPSPKPSDNDDSTALKRKCSDSVEEITVLRKSNKGKWKAYKSRSVVSTSGDEDVIIVNPKTKFGKPSKHAKKLKHAHNSQCIETHSPQPIPIPLITPSIPVPLTPQTFQNA